MASRFLNISQPILFLWYILIGSGPDPYPDQRIEMQYGEIFKHGQMCIQTSRFAVGSRGQVVSFKCETIMHKLWKRFCKDNVHEGSHIFQADGGHSKIRR